MEENDQMASAPLNQPLAPRRRGRRWLLLGGLAVAFMFALAVGVFLGSSTGSTQAAALTSGSSNSVQTLAAAQNDTANSQPPRNSSGNGFAQQPNFGSQAPGAQGPQGQCESLTVSSASGSTIVAKTASGSTVTVHTTASTKYTQAGKTVAASAIKPGVRISVMGTHNSDGSITATSIVIG
ncbi:MAG TPA: DUF5666 domain-containing protein [Ktedonobacteraceae bacterium]|nr:DUF5666 domain-containing protein [Ktedonobacteraceae bacterium]